MAGKPKKRRSAKAAAKRRLKTRIVKTMRHMVQTGELDLLAPERAAAAAKRQSGTEPAESS